MSNSFGIVSSPSTYDFTHLISIDLWNHICIYTYIYNYIHLCIYIYMCVCVCIRDINIRSIDSWHNFVYGYRDMTINVECHVEKTIMKFIRFKYIFRIMHGDCVVTSCVIWFPAILYFKITRDSSSSSIGISSCYISITNWLVPMDHTRYAHLRFVRTDVVIVGFRGHRISCIYEV